MSDNRVRLNFSVHLGFQFLPDDKFLLSTALFSIFMMSDFILIALSDDSVLKQNTLLTLLSEYHIARSEFNISEIRQQAGPLILGWLALQRLME